MVFWDLEPEAGDPSPASPNTETPSPETRPDPAASSLPPIPSDLLARVALARGFGLDPAGKQGLHAGMIQPGITLIAVPDANWAFTVTGVLHKALSATATGCSINCLHPHRIERGAARQQAAEDPFGRRGPRWAGDDTPRPAGPDAIVILSPHYTTVSYTGSTIGRAEGGTGTVPFENEHSLCLEIATMLPCRYRILYVTLPATELPAPIRAVLDRRIDLIFDTSLLGPLIPALFPEQTAPIAPLCGIGTAPAALDPLLLDLAYRAEEPAEVYLARLGLGIGAMANGGNHPASPVQPPGFPVRLADVRGLDRARDWGCDLVADIAACRRHEITLADLDPGALFFGPPGTGKTKLAQLIAREAGVPFIHASAADWNRETGFDGYLKAMGATFRQARATVPSILFLDEVDAFWTRTARRDHNSSYWTATLTALLQELDGVGGREGLIVIGATNRIENVDPALQRPGRLDRVIRIDLPGFEGLRELFEHYLPGVLSEAELDLAAFEAVGLRATGANVESWARGVRRRARRAGRNPSCADLMAEIIG